MMETENTRSIFDVFATSQETFEEAKKKSSEESKKRAQYFRISKDGTYAIRILPLAPVIDQDGKPLPLERKGYEYPLRSLMLKIEDPNKIVKGKPSINYVTVCNTKHVFKEGLTADPIDTYVNVACEKYAGDEKLCKKLREGSFSGGLKWDARRCMYIIDLENPGEGIQILQLSYSQYKDLEERKLNLWGKLNKNGKNAPCPISSIADAYPVEITRKTEGGKPNYSFNIDTVSDKSPLTEENLQALLDMPRMPEQIYRYTRYHLEATMAYLEQLDEQFDIDVANSEPVKECIAQIKTLLPADDQSHFTLNSGKGEENSKTGALTLDALWDRYDALCKQELDDQTNEGQDLRVDIMAFIDANNLNVAVTRRKTNEDILNEIEDQMTEDEDSEDKESKPVSKKSSGADSSEEDEDEAAEPTTENEDEEEDDEPSEPTSSRYERNDDTNEPAVRPSRRGGRPPRRRG